MIPTYNRSKYLTQTLESVLRQGYDAAQMQIEVIDNCSRQSESETIVKRLAPARVTFYRQPKHVSMSENWNTCIQRARGALVHILHDDDFVSETFYREMDQMAKRYPSCAFLASRSFFIDQDGVITGVTPRVVQMEQPTCRVAPMLKEQFFQTPGVVVRRRFYEQFGGFAPQLVYCLDWEMWVRAVHCGGGVVHSQPLASFRMYPASESGKLARSAENVREILRLGSFFSRYPGFSERALRALATERALAQHRSFLAERDMQAARANAKVYAEIVPLSGRLVRRAIDGARKVIQDIRSGLAS